MVKWLICSVVLFFIGCGIDIPTPHQRTNTAKQIASSHNLKPEIFKTSEFKLFSFHNELENCKKAYIYVEGDGLSWITSSQVSNNPTPINPTSLKIASKSKKSCIVYLARPCQYTNDSLCTQKYWTTDRFSLKVIKSYQDVLDTLKMKYNIDSFNLYGYSGGGAIVTLLSAFRNDIDLLTTYAGNLDTKYWCDKHYLTPLSHSLNPADFIKKLENQNQIHFIGAKDKNVDKSVFFSYYNKFKDKHNIKYKIMKNYTHNCCW